MPKTVRPYRSYSSPRAAGSPRAIRAMSAPSSPALSLVTTSGTEMDDSHGTDSMVSFGCPQRAYLPARTRGKEGNGTGMARQFAIVFGAIYVLIGILGFILPSPLLGIFGVNTLHNIVHLVIGGLWLVAAFAAPMGPDSARVT